MNSGTVLFRLLPAALFLLVGCAGAVDPTIPPGQSQSGGEFRIESTELLQAESWPVQLFLEIEGTLPSTCHVLDYAVILPGKDGNIEVEARASAEREGECPGGSREFKQGIGLGSYTEGEFVVLLNGERVGEVQIGGGSQDSEPEQEMTEGPVYVDETELAILESFPVQVELVIRGALPTPCASLKWAVEPPDADGQIHVEAYSVQQSGLDCIQVLAELEERLPIGSFTEGSYSVWLNGELVGDFEV